MKKYIKTIAVLFSALVFPLFITTPANAVYFGTGTNINIPQNQKIDETAFIAGETLTIDANVNGDLFCAGRSIVINGNVKGDVLCAGQDIKINGSVDGDVRVMGQDVEISGVVVRNVNTLSQNLVLAKKSQIKGDIIFGGQQVDLRGSLGRDLAGAGETVTINGSLLRNAQITASNINVSDTASISGTLDYYVENTGIYNQSSPKSIAGIVTHHEITRPENTSTNVKAKETAPLAIIWGKFISIISFTLLAFLLIYCTPKRTAKIVEIIKTGSVKSFFLGLGVAIISPFVLLLMCLTVIGLPSAMIVFLVYIVSVITGSLHGSMLIGNLISTKFNLNKTGSLYLEAFIGCLVVGIVTSIPAVGWLTGLFLLLSGLGATVLSYLPEKK